MTEPRYTLHHADALDVLREMPAETVDAVVTDPPFSQEYRTLPPPVEQRHATGRASAPEVAVSHLCSTPPTALPGDEWTCPECGLAYWADDTEETWGEDTFEWRRAR